ncbi:MAG TPA: ABC transporter ATP-binding protein [Thermomicrobiales bacterium]|nr:ABC transporter ATP-binding protein [Thermomicrobiales bacterium]
MLQIANLTKTYGSSEQAVHAVQDVSLSAQAGEFLAVIGPSGSGKTTLLAMIGGLLTPTSGAISLAGRDIARMSSGQLAAFRRQSVGYVFQANNLLPYLTARENLLVMEAIGARRGAGKQRADQLLHELGMDARANAVGTELSGGERQRVAIARALMNDPELVLVDEPTASLDSSRGKQVVQLLIDETKARSKLAIMVTHDLDMAIMADRILEMRDGVLREQAG